MEVWKYGRLRVELKDTTCIHTWRTDMKVRREMEWSLYILFLSNLAMPILLSVQFILHNEFPCRMSIKALQYPTSIIILFKMIIQSSCNM